MTGEIAKSPVTYRDISAGRMTAAPGTQRVRSAIMESVPVSPVRYIPLRVYLAQFRPAFGGSRTAERDRAIAENPSSPVTEKALYEAAGRSQATLNRYPDMNEKLAEIRAGRDTVSTEKSKAEPEQAGANHRLRSLQQASATLVQRVAIL
jgi:hypothetical protein